MRVQRAGERIMRKKRKMVALDAFEDYDPVDIKIKRHCLENCTDVSNEDLSLDLFDASQAVVHEDPPDSVTESSADAGSESDSE